MKYILLAIGIFDLALIFPFLYVSWFLNTTDILPSVLCLGMSGILLVLCFMTILDDSDGY